MAEPVGFEGVNAVFRAPEGWTQEQCRDLQVFRDEDGKQLISCWRLTPEELALVAATGVVWLSITGLGMPPVLVSGKALVLINGEPAVAEPVVPLAPRTGG